VLKNILPTPTHDRGSLSSAILRPTLFAITCTVEYTADKKSYHKSHTKSLSSAIYREIIHEIERKTYLPTGVRFDLRLVWKWWIFSERGCVHVRFHERFTLTDSAIKSIIQLTTRPSLPSWASCSSPSPRPCWWTSWRSCPREMRSGSPSGGQSRARGTRESRGPSAERGAQRCGSENALGRGGGGQGTENN
jgi:hypothetical protein